MRDDNFEENLDLEANDSNEFVISKMVVFYHAVIFILLIKFSKL